MAEEKTRVFPKGIMAFKPNNGAPEFILSNVVITLEDFREWVNGEGKQYLTQYNGKSQIRLTALQSDKSGINFQVDTYRKESAQNKIAPNAKTNDTAKTPNDQNLF